MEEKVVPSKVGLNAKLTVMTQTDHNQEGSTDQRNIQKFLSSCCFICIISRLYEQHCHVVMHQFYIWAPLFDVIYIH